MAASDDNVEVDEGRAAFLEEMLLQRRMQQEAEVCIINNDRII